MIRQVVKNKNTVVDCINYGISIGGEQGIRTLAPVTRPTPLAGEPLHHLGNSPQSAENSIWLCKQHNNYIIS